MPFAFVFVQLIDADEYTGLLHSSKLVVNGRAKDEHCGRKVHIGIDEGRYIAAPLPNLGIEHTVVKLEVGFRE